MGGTTEWLLWARGWERFKDGDPRVPLMVSGVALVSRTDRKDSEVRRSAQRLPDCCKYNLMRVLIKMTGHFHPYGSKGHGPFENITKTMGDSQKHIHTCTKCHV